MLPEPVWPVLVLAMISTADAVLCLRSTPFITRCLEDVRWPRRFWQVLPGIKFAAAAGLVLGVWVPWLAVITTTCLVAYFVIAIAMHLAARDLGRNLFLNAFGMLAISGTTTVFCFLL